MLLADKQLQSIITSYTPYEIIRDTFDEVYSTTNDRYLLISKELFHYIVGNMRAALDTLIPADEKQILVSEKYYDFLTKNDLSIEDIESLYGDTIIQRYLDNQRKESRARQMSNLCKGNIAHRENASYRRAQIISLILNRYTKQEIEDILGISRSTIDRALRGLDSLKLRDIIVQYTGSVFKNFDWDLYGVFVGVECSYSKFRKLLAGEYDINTELSTK